MKNLKPFTRDIALSIVTPEQRIRRQNITSKSSVLKVVSHLLYSCQTVSFPPIGQFGQ